jgi:hypothetical protein
MGFLLVDIEPDAISNRKYVDKWEHPSKTRIETEIVCTRQDMRLSLRLNVPTDGERALIKIFWLSLDKSIETRQVEMPSMRAFRAYACRLLLYRIAPNGWLYGFTSLPLDLASEIIYRDLEKVTWALLPYRHWKPNCIVDISLGKRAGK